MSFVRDAFVTTRRRRHRLHFQADPLHKRSSPMRARNWFNALLQPTRSSARRFTLLLLLNLTPHVFAQSELECRLVRDINEGSPGDSVPEFSVPSKVERVRAELEHLALQYNTSVPVWEARADEVRRGILKGAGLAPLPFRQRMDRRSRNTIVGNGYTIENLALEISPGYWLTGNLYRPLGRIGKVPAIAHPIGHFKKDGWLTRTQPEMQARAGHLAQLGAIVFAYDMVGWGETRQVPHSSKRALALQLWNSIRVIDFLVSLPEVDAGRIAMIGASSGGTQTILAAAVDPRIAVSVPVVKITALTAGGCTCETGMPIRSETGTNNAEIAALVAPKPLLIVTDGEDDTKYFPHLEQPYIEGIYRLYGAEARFRNVHLADEGHDFGINKRKAVYDFLAEQLGLDRIPIVNRPSKYPENVIIEKSDALRIWTAGFYGPHVGDFMVLLPTSPVPGWIYD
ncbi:MAG TPA: CocE/NonD family hydrolase [Thermoanaerobaculia bacterium]|nr:CocE/NonD family hydrolase [Thermoanaerobaculia bacterium]